MTEPTTREEMVRQTAEVLQISEVAAEFIVAQELGEIQGDVIDVEGDVPAPE